MPLLQQEPTLPRPPSASSPIAAVTRRPFRVASRRRPVSTTLTTSTTTTTTTTQATVDELASEELLQDIVDIGDTDAIEDPTLTTRAPPRNTAKVQRRPLVSLKDEDQNPSATNEDERKRQSKKYSATFKQNQLDQALRQKEDETTDATTEGRTTVEDISAETAVALAAHQLLAAPIPIIQDYDENVKPTKKTTPVQTTVEYKFTSPEYTDDYKVPTYTEEYTNTPSYTNTGYSQTGTGYTGPNSNGPTTYSTDIFAKVSRPGYSTNLINPTISGPQSVGVDGSTARYTQTDTNGPTTYEYTTRGRPGYSANLITPTASGVTINVGEEVTGRYTVAADTAPPTFPTLFTGKVSKPSGFSATPATQTLRERSTVRYQVSSEKLAPTVRYQNSNGPIPVPVDFGYSTDAYSPSQEPSYFTREYLLESPVTKAYDDEYQYLSPITTPQTTTTTTTTKPPKKKTVFRKISTTLRPTTAAAPETTTTPKPRRVTTRKPFDKIQKVQKILVKEENKTYRPIANYDYYDDSNEKMVGKYEEGTKVVLHGKDSIECLDIGNFPHPTSCKKFISCARIENGSLLGWEYICPKGLSFDPVGGICNWSAGLGCDEKDL
ncbi:uncharacterized protein [Epargyreus clarus]|uniref:uncharacterized protein n=1 Tax=Epargyreus clarus TaxID=520877 RepID=UPI003C2C54E0